MSSEGIIAVLGAVTALVVAGTALVVQLRSLRKDLNGRLEQLLAVAAAAARKEGELAGRDFASRGGPASPPS